MTPKVPTPTPEQKVLINWFINEEKAKARRIRAEKAALRKPPCEQCKIRKEAPLYNAYNINCLQCGADGSAGIRRFCLPKDAEKKRLRAWLDDYVKWGHSEAELRRLAKG